MENTSKTIQVLVSKIKVMMVASTMDPYLCVSPSAYDTAWLAMIQNPKEESKKPLFFNCLNWILMNQKSQGYWGESDCSDNPTIDSLPATIACMIALKKWGVGLDHIQKGMAFINENSTQLLEALEKNEELPRWFTITFPGMVQLAQRNDLPIQFADHIKQVVVRIFQQRHLILTSEKMENKFDQNSPLMSCLEVLPEEYQRNYLAKLVDHLDENGCLFGSPSATAVAFMATGNQHTLSYLKRLVAACPNGVPTMYPIDDDCIKLYMVYQLQRLGLSAHFSNEMNEILDHLYRKFIINAKEPSKQSLIPITMLKEALAFQVFRLNGYKVSPGRLCGFLDDGNHVEQIEKNYEKFSSVILSLYQATNLMFQGELELQDLRSFSKRLLEKSCQSKSIDDVILMWPHLQQEIKREISVPWFARMEHLEHRKWIEANKKRPLWLGKFSFFRIPCIDNMYLLQLAQLNYVHRQGIYRIELEELIRWSKFWGLKDMGFAREKTTYCYFALASSFTLPCHSDVRLIIAKSAVLVTIFDDFFDMEGSLDELQILTQAIKQWNGEGLKSHSRIMFDALDHFVTDTANKYLHQHGFDIRNKLRHLWYETIESWLMEATWSRTGQIPSMETYIKTGMISIAVHTIVLPSSFFMMPTLTAQDLIHSQYQPITKYLMMSCRLSNDLQSYEKEQKDGKFNSVSLYMKENPNANLQDAINYVQNMLDESKRMLLELALNDGNDHDLPNTFKMMHLCCLKVFEMFFNSENYFDSKDSLLNDINKAIYEPLEHYISLVPSKSPPLQKPGPSFQDQPKKKISIRSFHGNSSLKINKIRTSSLFAMYSSPRGISIGTHQRMITISPYNYTLSIV